MHSFRYENFECISLSGIVFSFEVHFHFLLLRRGLGRAGGRVGEKVRRAKMIIEVEVRDRLAIWISLALSFSGEECTRGYFTGDGFYVLFHAHLRPNRAKTLVLIFRWSASTMWSPRPHTWQYMQQPHIQTAHTHTNGPPLLKTLERSCYPISRNMSLSIPQTVAHIV